MYIHNLHGVSVGKSKLGTMYLRVCVWALFLVAGYGITSGSAYTGVSRCIQGEERGTAVIKSEFCLATKTDVHMTCPPNKFIVFNSVKFAVKHNVDICAKRVLAEKHMFCCTVEDNDVLYDGECLHDAWSSEDTHHFQQFMSEALEQCRNTSYCRLSAHPFNNLQRKIPTTKRHSSYIQLLYQCINAPTSASKVDICSSTSTKGDTILVHDSFTSRNDDKNCTCHVTANTPVTVRAVDVRTTNSRLIIKSDNRVKDVSAEKIPVFGLKSIITARKFDINLERLTRSSGDNVLLQISGLNREDISVICGEQMDKRQADAKSPDGTWTVKSTPKSPNGIAKRNDNSGYGEYTPMIYAGIGSGLTIVLTACIFGGYFICRYCTKKRNRPYERPYHGQFSGQYDAVYNGMPHPPPEWVNTGSTLHKNQRTLRGLHQPMAPTLPPPNKHGHRTEDNTQPCGVSDFDAFLAH